MQELTTQYCGPRRKKVLTVQAWGRSAVPSTGGNPPTKHGKHATDQLNGLADLKSPHTEFDNARGAIFRIHYRMGGAYHIGPDAPGAIFAFGKPIGEWAPNYIAVCDRRYFNPHRPCIFRPP